MKRFFAVLLAALLAWSAPALATIGTPTKTGSTSGTNSGSSFAVTGGSAGDAYILLISPKTASATVSSVADSASDAYSKVASIAGTPSTEVWWVHATTSAPTTVTVTTSSGQYSAVALDVTGLSATADKALTGSFSAATTFSQSTGTLAQASEILFAWSAATATAYGTITPASGFTAITAPSTFYLCEYDIVSATTSLTVAPTWGSSTAGTYNVVSFEGAASASTSPTLMLLGVGWNLPAANDNDEFKIAVGQ